MKLKQLPIVILLSMTLSGCTNTTFNKSMDAAENALANKEFEKASGLLELALQEKEKKENKNTVMFYYGIYKGFINKSMN